MQQITIKDLLDAGVHFGHQTRRWNPKMKKYIFMERNRIHIIDLQFTMKAMEQAGELVQRAVSAGGSVLFVGTKKQAVDIIEEEARRCGMFFVTTRWLGGMLTNFQTIKMSVRRLRTLERMREDGSLQTLTKKEASKLEKEYLKLEKTFSGVKEMHRLPGAIFVVDTKKEAIAVHEAKRLEIPVIGLVDTNSDPDEIDYPIPANDDALRSIRLFARYIGDTILESKAVAPHAASASADEEKEATAASASENS
ncbi:MAG: 30S ribosomal protein S2 [Candidatus Eisenbacteria bacterium]|uniref:Small ribosomal subunit protein uS2 n=1 Tax=Eiseniibacteriota bacterium TaxID=2212470 RepID=A0A948W2Z7_UNCEI|nr:30S ribosomal protein S2 [Candidatus Eisenbacteria bacterium]MBU1950734.1 30S ribosomal protein S2 [Candidatus Eisenbacteria bacterium]MBU2690532.1 30S ribosomal protein S2 [Candidatus Eisenbacteria bacterium]